MNRRAPLLLALGLVCAGTAYGQGCELEVVGAHHLDVEACYDLAGDPPNDPDALRAWAQPAVAALLEGYHQRGYVAARAWARIRDRVAVIEVDEGEIHRVRILGVSTLDSLTLLDNLALAEGGVLYEPSLLESLEAVRIQRGARSVSYSLEDSDDMVRNSSGLLIPERMLTVEVVTPEARGFDVGIEVVPRWGLVTGVGWYGGRPDGKDHLALTLGIATPYQQWVTEQEPSFRWVYGVAGVRYRAAGFGGGPLAPVVGFQSSLANWHRVDLGLEGAMVQDHQAELGVSFEVTDGLRLDLGALLQGVDIYADERITAPIDGSTLLRGFATTRLSFLPDDGTVRTDLRDALVLDARLGSGTGEGPVAMTTLEGQWVQGLGRNHVLVRSKSGAIRGPHRFFDELPIAGRYQRVFFGDQYWTAAASQLEVAGRLYIRRSFRLGAFHDVSVFADRLDPSVARAVNAVGPSVHLLLLNSFAIDFYWGYGWSVDGGSQNLSLTLKNVY